MAKQNSPRPKTTPKPKIQEQKGRTTPKPPVKPRQLPSKK